MGPTHSIVVIWDTIFQTESMVEIYSKSPVRAIGKVFSECYTSPDTSVGLTSCIPMIFLVLNTHLTTLVPAGSL